MNYCYNKDIFLKGRILYFLIFMEGMTNQGMTCSCTHHYTVPTLVVLFGLIFLLKALNVVTAELIDLAWPVLVIAAGLLKMKSRMCKCC